MSTDEDSQLIREIKEGNRQAFAVLVRKYSKYFYAVAYRYLSDRTEAEDMAQQAFLKLWEFPHKFDASKGASFKTWFTQVLINLCIDFRRKNHHRFEDIEEMQIESVGKNPFQQACNKQVFELLEEAIRKLPIPQQHAVNLGLYQGIPYAEVAQIMKTSLPAVKSLIMRGKENIKKYLKEYGNVEEEI